MATKVDITYNPYTFSNTLLLDGQPVPSEADGLNAIFSGNFSAWGMSFADDLYDQLNESFELTVRSGRFEVELIKAIAGSHRKCTSVIEKPMFLDTSVRQRLSDLASLSKEIPGMSALPSSYNFRLGRTSGSLSENAFKRVNDLLQHSKYFSYDSSNMKVRDIPYPATTITSSGIYGAADIVIVGTPDELHGVVSSHPAGENLFLSLCTGSGILRVSDITSEGYAVTVSDDMVDKVIYWFVEHFLAAKHINKAASIIESWSKAATRNFYSLGKAKAISRSEPYVQIQAEQSIEIGKSAALTINNYPETKIDVVIGDPSIASFDGKSVRGLKCGTTDVRVSFHDYQRTIGNFTLTIFKVKRVTNIIISAPKVMRENSTGKATASCTPSDAVNIGNLKWSTYTPSIVRIDNNGTITALAGGKGIICANVDGIKATHDIDVQNIAKRIILTEDKITIGMTDFTHRVTGKIDPPNAVNGKLSSVVLDTGVLDYDSYSGLIRPKCVGCTDIVFSITDNGSTICQKSCTVNIVPTNPARYSKPDVAQILSIIFTVIFGLLSASYACAAAFIGWGITVVTMLLRDKEKHISLAVIEFIIMLLLFIFVTLQYNL